MSKYMGFTRAVDVMSGRVVKGFFLINFENAACVRWVLSEQPCMTAGVTTGSMFLGLADEEDKYCSHAEITISTKTSASSISFAGPGIIGLGVAKWIIDDQVVRSPLPDLSGDSSMLFLIEHGNGEIMVGTVFDTDIDAYADPDLIEIMFRNVIDLTKDQRESLALSYPEHRDALIAREAITSQNEMYSF